MPLGQQGCGHRQAVPCFFLLPESELQRSRLLKQGLQTPAQGPTPAHCLFLCSLGAKNGFYIFKWLEKKSKGK